MSDNIIEFKPNSVRAMINAEVQRLENNRGKNTPISAREALIHFADILEGNARYLDDHFIDKEAFWPVTESLIEVVANIRYWLDVEGGKQY